MSQIKKVERSSLGAILKRYRGFPLTDERIEELRIANEMEKQEVIAIAVENALRQERDEKQELQRQNALLAVAYEKKAAESAVDGPTGAISKHHFENTVLPNYVQLLCTNRRNLDRRSLWPILHFIDGRKFGAYNKTWNQLTGDRIIAMLAHVFMKAVRSSDLMGRQFDYVGRVGGDEFAILQTDIDTHAEAFDSPQRFIVGASKAHWGEIKSALTNHPPLFDMGSVCVKEASLRVKRLSDGEMVGIPTEDIPLITTEWYAMAAETLLEAKALRLQGVSSSVIHFVEWDRNSRSFLKVPEEEIRQAELRQHIIEL